MLKRFLHSKNKIIEKIQKYILKKIFRKQKNNQKSVFKVPIHKYIPKI